MTLSKTNHFTEPKINKEPLSPRVNIIQIIDTQNGFFFFVTTKHKHEQKDEMLRAKS